MIGTAATGVTFILVAMVMVPPNIHECKEGKFDNTSQSHRHCHVLDRYYICLLARLNFSFCSHTGTILTVDIDYDFIVIITM